MAEKPYDRIGGKVKLHGIISAFYDRIFDDFTLSQFFVGVKKEQQVSQFTDFMAQMLGGPKMYMGRMPKDAHPHLFIEREHFQMRHYILKATLEQAGIELDLIDLLLKMDLSFEEVIVKKSFSECEKRFNSDDIISVLHKRAS